MGLGKTITTLAFLLQQKQTKGPAPTLVVCPTSVATNWVREAERFTPNLGVLLLHGPSPTARASSRIDRHDVVITTYALLRRDLETLTKVRFRAIVLDEAQYVKNADSQTRRAAGKLDAEMRLALTGTPVENRLKELWSIASFVNPGLLGSERGFELRFERPIAIDPKSPRAAELRATMRPFLLRRTKDQVLTDLPAKTEIERHVELAPADQKLYDALALTLREKIAQAMEKMPGASQLNIFTALTRLRQMACEPRLIDPRLPASRSCKREVFLDLVRELVAEGRRALVFSQFVELLTLWRADLDAEGIAYEYLDGSTKQRSDVVDRFQNGTAPLFLISLKAGGFGLNLTAADTVIHCDPWWNPAVEDQATDRAYRIGQDKPVTVVRLIASGTIEEKILSLKAKKRALTQAVIHNDAAALRGIAEEELLELLGGFAAPAPDAPKLGKGAPTDLFATEDEVLRPEYGKLVAEARRWLETTGGFEAELATKVGIPVPFASRLARGEPFPCSRATAQRIFTRLREW
jgi:SNF2 family DNA or RNA helicase